jgi:uncharacterized protein (DUF1330 family)
LIAQLAVHDVETYRTYALAVADTIGPHGGTLLVANDEAIVLEGQQPYPRTVIGSFPTVDAARAWYDSDAYRAIQPLRSSASLGTVYIVEGFSLPSAPQTAKGAS